MKRFLVLAIGLLFCGLSFTPARADLSGSAVATIDVTVSPYIEVTNRISDVNVGAVKSGPFSASIAFGITANGDKVRFVLEASDLYKGDDPSNIAVPPVPLDKTKPVQIIPQSGGRNGGGPGEAVWDSGSGEVIAGFPTSKTLPVVFVSGQNRIYVQDVVFKLFYLQSEAVKPSGQYSGKVRLTAVLEMGAP